VIPEPQKQSSITSPGFEEAKIMVSSMDKCFFRGITSALDIMINRISKT
jgi:hypothetical protein